VPPLKNTPQASDSPPPAPATRYCPSGVPPSTLAATPGRARPRRSPPSGHRRHRARRLPADDRNTLEPLGRAVRTRSPSRRTGRFCGRRPA
jgi:hypothetical protein